MSRIAWVLAALAFAVASCAGSCRTPAPPPAPTVTGGAGPAPIETGGTAAAGGQASTGGAGCPIVDYPDTPLPQTLDRKVVRRKLPPRHFRHPGRARALIAIAPLCSGGALPLVVTPLNQVDGSCTGAASVGMISTPPFTSAVHFTVADALLAYQGGTCVDNGCAVCSCAKCPGAYCPATHANDYGSTGGSVLTWMVTQRWIGGYVTADITDALLAGLAESKSCVVGVDWRESMWDTDPATCEIRVDMKTALVGGHEMHAVLSDVTRKRVYVRNSWGPWGCCYREQMTSASPVDGTGCGYGWLSLQSLTALRYDADCPVAP